MARCPDEARSRLAPRSDLPRRAWALATGASLAAFALAAAGCTPAAAPVQQAEACKPADVAITIIASKNINRDEDGQPRPVQIRLYQLKTDSGLLNAAFDDLWKDDKTTLKDDLVKVDEFPVYPDTRSEGKFGADASARFVVGVALFHNPLGRSWWTEFELPVSTKGHCAPSPATFAIYVDQTRVTEGSDHIDEYPDKTRIHTLALHFDPPSNPAKSDEARSP
jgi:type VI secretion system protein VasD